MIPLPSVKPVYDQEVLNTMGPSERQAAFYGVDRRFLRFASSEYISDVDEHYNLHQYSTINFSGITITYDEQFTNVKKLLNSGMLWSDPAGVIIINSPSYFFDGGQGAEAFLSHLICSLAHRVVTRKAPALDVNFLEVMQLDHTKTYQLKPRHLLVWGPVTDHFSSYDFNKTIQFLFSFRNYTRILLTSTQDMESLLSQLKMHVNHAAYYFNFNIMNSTTTEPIKRKTYKRKPKAEKHIVTGV